MHSRDAAMSLGLGIGFIATIMTFAGAVPGVMWLRDKGRISLRSLMALGAALVFWVLAFLGARPRAATA
jgi:hypothetical protein